MWRFELAAAVAAGAFRCIGYHRCGTAYEFNKNMLLFFLAEFMDSADDVVGGCPSCIECADCGDECEAEDFVEQEVEDECG